MLTYTDIVDEFFVLFARNTRKGTNGIFALLIKCRAGIDIGRDKALVYISASLDGISLKTGLALTLVLDCDHVFTTCGTRKGSHRIAAFLIDRTDRLVGSNSSRALVKIRATLVCIALVANLAHTPLLVVGRSLGIDTTFDGGTIATTCSARGMEGWKVGTQCGTILGTGSLDVTRILWQFRRGHRQGHIRLVAHGSANAHHDGTLSVRDSGGAQCQQN
jgi:hypothetical protein